MLDNITQKHIGWCVVWPSKGNIYEIRIGNAYFIYIDVLNEIKSSGPLSNLLYTLGILVCYGRVFRARDITVLPGSSQQLLGYDPSEVMHIKIQ